jgi:hypothetical protein
MVVLPLPKPVDIDMRTHLLTAVTALALTLPAHSAEVDPTPKMLQDAKQLNSANPDYSAETKYEYHFRNIGGHVPMVRVCSGLTSLKELRRESSLVPVAGQADHP